MTGPGRKIGAPPSNLLGLTLEVDGLCLQSAPLGVQDVEYALLQRIEALKEADPFYGRETPA